MKKLLIELKIIVEKVSHLKPGEGLNTATGEYVDMIATGIIDPAKTRLSVLSKQ